MAWTGGDEKALEAGAIFPLEGPAQRGMDRVDGTQVPLAAVLEPSDWLSEAGLGRGCSLATVQVALAHVSRRSRLFCKLPGANIPCRSPTAHHPGLVGVGVGMVAL